MFQPFCSVDIISVTDLSLASTSKRAPVLCLRAIRAKAKFCDHSILLKLFPETFIGFMFVHVFLQCCPVSPYGN